MTYHTQIAAGVAQLCPVPCSVMPVDKWQILDALSTAAEEFELTHRTLSVLRALVSFLPDRTIDPTPGSTIVFPSNRTLSDRLYGMPESTLRRHLSRLVSLGIINRSDSANRKRYARTVAGTRAIAFGFDLSPLALHAVQIQTAATETQHRAERIHLLRDHIAQLRQDLVQFNDPAHHNLLEHSRLLLRRRTSESILEQTARDLTVALDELASKPVDETLDNQPETHSEILQKSVKMSTDDVQNERHIHKENKSFSDSEQPIVNSRATSAPPQHGAEDNLHLDEVMSLCKEYKTLFPEPIRSWQSLHATAYALAPMLGIDQPVFLEAQKIMGKQIASVLVLCILERNSEIKSPGAYLRALCQRAKNGLFSITPTLAALRIRDT